MSPSSVITKLVIFGAGVAVGWFIAQNVRDSDRTPPSYAPALVTDAPAETSARQTSRSVWLTVEFDGGSALVPAARIGSSGLLLASLYGVYPANSVYYTNARGEQVFPGVVASDPIANLIAFKDEPGDGYRVSDEDGSLFVGKRVVLTLAENTLEGQIESPLQTAPNGRYYFDVAFSQSGSQRGGPLLDAESEELIGFVTTVRGTPPAWMQLSGRSYGAIDATSIRTFLRSAPHAPQSVRDFSASFALTPGGLRYSISRLADREQWGTVFSALERLLTIDNDNSDVTQQALTLAAYYHGHQLLDDGEARKALGLVSDMRQRFPQEQPWCLVAGRAHTALLQWKRAFEESRLCLQTPFGTSPRDSELLVSPARNALIRIGRTDALVSDAHEAAIRYADTQASRADRMNVLLDALSLGEHAQVYRLLGDFEYEAQNYAVAQDYYRSALRLDPSISASLGNRLRNSTQRAGSAPAAEIEFENFGGGIVVNATLNDSPQSFRLLVDTGATYSALSGGTLLRLGLGNVLSGVSEVVELEAAGGRLYAQRFTLDSMQIGSARVTQVPVVILENMEGFDGLVGLSFLRHFDVSLDQEGGKLILMRR